MSASRLLSVLVAVVLVVTGIFVARAGIATSAVTSVLDQSDRHPGFVNLSLASADQAYLAYRRGEWNAGNAASNASNASSAALDQSDRHPIDSAALAGQAYMAYRRGEWNAGNSTAAAYDIELEQARQHWPAAK